MKDKPLVIGIAGGSGSGKSTITEKIKGQFPDNVAVICHDNYYKSHDDMPLEDRAKINYDHPEAFDTSLMVEDLKRLKEWQTVEIPTYSYIVHNRLKETLTVEPKDVILAEGILLFEDEALRELIDIKIFVDAPADLRFIRRMLRDVNERGRTLDSVVSQYITTVKPMHDKFVEPTKDFADIIVTGGGFNEIAIDIISSKVAAWVGRGVK